MFTGIIETTAKILESDKKNQSLFLKVEKPKRWKLKQGDSVAVNGTCLTVQKINKKDFLVELMKETLDKTIFGKGKIVKVNLERPLEYSKRFDGHVVLGHVDTVGVIEEIKKKSTSKLLTISFPKEFSKLLIEKGSVVVNGASLTCFNVSKMRFTVSLVSYTLDHTTFNESKKGDVVNLEFDIIGKYIAKHYAK